MKKRLQTVIIFAVLICMSLSGCNKPTATPTSTQSSTEPSAKNSVTTVTEAVVAVTTVTAPQTETPKVEVKIPEFYETTEPTEVITDPPDYY